MYKNKDWIKKVISNQETNKVPYNFDFSPPVRQFVEEHYGGSPIEEVLNFPIRMNAPNSIKPLYAEPSVYGKKIVDEFGVVWSTSSIDRGSPIGPCLPKPDLSDYKFPNANASYRFENLRDWCLENQKNFTIIWIGDLWERATFMRGMENLLIDLVLNSSFVNRILYKITEYILETIKILHEKFRFDGIALSDDYGSQKSMLMSPKDWRKFIKPCLKKIYSLAKKYKKYTFHHSCGNIYPIIGDLIDIGLDILHPIQPEVMDIFKLKRNFGKYITFCGGISTQYLLPRGTVKEIKDEIKKLKNEMAKRGGYILEPGITVQADIPHKNLIAMIDEVVK